MQYTSFPLSSLLTKDQLSELTLVKTKLKEVPNYLDNENSEVLTVGVKNEKCS